MSQSFAWGMKLIWVRMLMVCRYAQEWWCMAMASWRSYVQSFRTSWTNTNLRLLRTFEGKKLILKRSLLSGAFIWFGFLSSNFLGLVWQASANLIINFPELYFLTSVLGTPRTSLGWGKLVALEIWIVGYAMDYGLRFCGVQPVEWTSPSTLKWIWRIAAKWSIFRCGGSSSDLSFLTTIRSPACHVPMFLLASEKDFLFMIIEHSSCYNCLFFDVTFLQCLPGVLHNTCGAGANAERSKVCPQGTCFRQGLDGGGFCQGDRDDGIKQLKWRR